MCDFIIKSQVNIEYIRIVALFVLQKLDLKMLSKVLQTSDVSCFGNSFMATECISKLSRYITEQINIVQHNMIRFKFASSFYLSKLFKLNLVA